MIRIVRPETCCGCGACLQACPQGCISLVYDAEGFEYPQVDLQRCTDCGRCERVCPLLNRDEPRMPLKVLGARADDDAVRMDSSSGGMFHALSSKIIGEGGVVFAARFDEHLVLRQSCAGDMAELPPLMGAKYVQSSNHDSYRLVARHLKAGRKVLYCGTPCQVAGLRHYLGRDDDLLLTADLICHGVPSPGVWQSWVGAQLSRWKVTADQVQKVSFRDKRAGGWRAYQFVVRLKDGCEHRLRRSCNTFQQAFDEGLTLRPSCYACPMRKGRSHSDLTLADFWDVTYLRPDFDDNKGVSLVLCNTEKGRRVLPSEGLQYMESDLEPALAHNPAFMAETTACHPRRDEFFSRWSSSSDTQQLLRHVLREPFIKYWLKRFNLWKYQLKLSIMRRLR